MKKLEEEKSPIRMTQAIIQHHNTRNTMGTGSLAQYRSGGSVKSGDYGMRKKFEIEEKKDPFDDLVGKCIQSQPNKMTLEKIRKDYAMVWSWGSNQKGELGVGHYKNAIMPEKVRGLPRVKVTNISSGGKHSGIVTEDGKLWMCGSNLHDKLGLEGIQSGSKKTFKPVELM